MKVLGWLLMIKECQTKIAIYVVTLRSHDRTYHLNRFRENIKSISAKKNKLISVN